jgi:RHS repeat-associated protein
MALAQEGGVSEFSGSAQYSVSLVIPPGNAGHQPNLALSYDSKGVKGGAGWVGLGWSVTGLSVIQRSTANGAPYDYADALACQPTGGGENRLCYAERYSIDGEELVPVEWEDGATRQRFRTRRDDGRRIHRVPALNQWEIRDRSGNLFVYGSSAASQVTNLKNNQAFSWHLASVTDPYGNWIRYQYTPGDGVLYPVAVLYSFGVPGIDPHDPTASLTATRRISFVLNDPTTDPRLDVQLNYKAGFRQAITRRIARIDVEAGSPLQVIARYTMAYGGEEEVGQRSRLTNIIREAPAGGGFVALPPYTFEYTDTTPGFAETPKTDFVGASGLGTNAPASIHLYQAGSYARHNRRLLDLNGDALVDLYDWDGNSGSHGTAYLNDGEGLGTGTSWWPSSPYPNWRRSLREELDNGNVRAVAIDFIDMNGDGLRDVPFDQDIGSSTFVMGVHLGTTTGIRSDLKTIDDWDTPGLIQQIVGLGEGYPTRQREGVVDVTGDGRADLFWGRYSQPEDSFGFVPALGMDPEVLTYRPGALTWKKPAGTYESLLDVYTGGTPPLYYAIHTMMVDVNGDGLVDHVSYGDGPRFISFNYGAGFETSDYSGFPEFFLTGGGGLWGASPSGVLCGDSLSVDINGDGCIDHVAVGGDPPDLSVLFGTCYGRYTLDPEGDAYGSAWPTQWPSVLPTGDCTFEPPQLVDVNGDGMVDYAHDLDTIYLNPGQPPGLLRRATTPAGGVTEFEYGAAAQEVLNDAPANPGLPTPMMVVKKLTVRDSGTATPVVDQFNYYSADYDRIEKEFRGFGTVRRARMNGTAEESVVVRTYATGALGRACRGELASEEIYGGGQLLRRVVNAYDANLGQTIPGVGRWEKCVLTESRTDHLEGLGEGNKRIVRTEYERQQVDPFNLMSVTTWGEEPEIGDAVDTGGDGRKTQFDYVSTAGLDPTDPYWVSTIERVREMDPSTTPPPPQPVTYTDTHYVYVGQCGEATDLRIPGRPTLMRGWRDKPSSAEIPLVRTCYDSHGNPTEVWGPATPSAPGGSYQGMEYEAMFRTFPSTVTLGEEAHVVPLVAEILYGHEGESCGLSAGSPAPIGLGLPCWETSPQDLVQRTSYDEFGRISRVEEANGVVTALTYQLPADPLESAETLVTRTVTSTVGTFVGRARLDGLGRVWRTEEPGTATPPETIYVDRTYDNNGRLSKATVPSNTVPTPFTRVQAFHHDALGRITGRWDFDATTEFRSRYKPLAKIDEVYFGTTRKAYEHRQLDGRGRVAWLETFKDVAGTGDLTGGYRTTLFYDRVGRLVKAEDPIRHDDSLCDPSPDLPNGMGPHCGAAGRHETTIEWDSLGRRLTLIDPDSGTTTFGYDDAGLVETITYAAGTAAWYASTYDYDALGRVIRREFSGPGGTASGISNATLDYWTTGSGKGLPKSVDADAGDGTDYELYYDALGRMSQEVQVTDGLEFVTTYGYDGAGRLGSKVLPDGSSKVFVYNGTRLTDAGLVKDIHYDALGRPLDYFSGYVKFEHTFDPATTRMTKILAKRNLSPAEEFMSLDVQFDGLGRNLSMTGHVDNPGTMSRSFDYDGLGRLQFATGEWEKPFGVSAPVTWEFKYDALGNLREQISDGYGGAYWRQWSYNHPTMPHGLSRFWEELGNGGDLIREDVAFDSAGRTDSVTRYVNGANPTTRDYQWNRQGLFQGISELQPGYHYDVFGRRVMQKFGSSADRVIYVGDDFEYNHLDGWGNTLHMLGGQIVATSGKAWVAPSAAALPPALILGFRGLGWGLVLVGAPLFLIGLVRMRPSVRWTTQPVWVRASASCGLGIALVLAPFRLWASPPPPDNPGSHGTHRADLLVYVRDHLGSVRLVINYPEAVVVEKRDYGPFGELVEEWGSFELHHRYTGQKHDENLDLEFYNARMYDRRWGRFVSPDPIVSGLSAEDINPYSYVRNQPTSLVDPTGREKIEIESEWIIETMDQFRVTAILRLENGQIDESVPEDTSWLGDIQTALGTVLAEALTHQAVAATAGVTPPQGVEAIEIYGSEGEAASDGSPLITDPNDAEITEAFEDFFTNTAVGRATAETLLREGRTLRVESLIGPKGSYYDPDTKTIRINKRTRMITIGRKKVFGIFPKRVKTRASLRRVVAHEVGHAMGHYDEGYVMDNYENPAARDWGEPERTEY